MDIGTAKPSIEERARLPHHLIDIRDPSEQFNVGDFVRLATEAADAIAGRGAFPVVSGGTGFYLKNFILGLPETPPSDRNIRDTLRAELQEKGAAALMEELARFDPASAEKIHLNDTYRQLRALEVQRLSGRPLSSFAASGVGARFRYIVIGLTRPREELYRRINERCAAMFSQGLPDEVRKLFSMGYTPRDPGIRAIGYHEFFIRDEQDSPHEPGSFEIDSSEPLYRFSNDISGVQALIAQNSRRYAKRQITFFASLPDVQWIEAGSDDAETALRIREKTLRLLSGQITSA